MGTIDMLGSDLVFLVCLGESVHAFLCFGNSEVER